MISYRNQEVIDVLTKARELIAQGWCKGASQDGTDYCMVGAVYKAETGYCWLTKPGGPSSEALFALMLHLPWQPNGKNAQKVIPKFNDHNTTTHADVLDVFDKTLADLGGT